MERGIWYWNLVMSIISSALLFFVGLFLFLGFEENALRIAIRTSARLAAIVFAMAFSAAALHHWLHNSFSFWLRMNRRHLGISFALLFLIHFMFLLVLQQCFHPVFNQAAWISLVGGGMAYIFAFLMLLTSFSYFSEKMSPQTWKYLHSIGGWWIWYIFIRSYFKRVFDMQGTWVYLPLLLLFLGILVLKLIKPKSKGLVGR